MTPENNWLGVPWPSPRHVRDTLIRISRRALADFARQANNPKEIRVIDSVDRLLRDTLINGECDPTLARSVLHALHSSAAQRILSDTVLHTLLISTRAVASGCAVAITKWTTSFNGWSRSIALPMEVKRSLAIHGWVESWLPNAPDDVHYAVLAAWDLNNDDWDPIIRPSIFRRHAIHVLRDAGVNIPCPTG